MITYMISFSWAATMQLKQPTDATQDVALISKLWAQHLEPEANLKQLRLCLERNFKCFILGLECLRLGSQGPDTGRTMNIVSK